MNTLLSALGIAILIGIAYWVTPVIVSWVLAPSVVREAERIVEG